MGLIKGKLFNKGNQFLPQAQLIGIDADNLLATQKGSQNFTYTATEDCIYIGSAWYEYGSSRPISQFFTIDGVKLYPSNPTVVFLKKGQVINTGGRSGYDNMMYSIYGIKH